MENMEYSDSFNKHKHDYSLTLLVVESKGKENFINIKKVLVDLAFEDSPLTIKLASSASEAKDIVCNNARVFLVFICLFNIHESLELIKYIRQCLKNNTIYIILCVYKNCDELKEKDIILNYHVDGIKDKESLTQSEIIRTVYAAISNFKYKQHINETLRIQSNDMSILSHEIRTTLNGISGMIGLTLEEGSCGETDHKSLTTALQSSKWLIELLNSVLDLSKTKTGKMELNINGFDLKTLVENTFQSFNHQAIMKKLKLSFNIKSDVPTELEGDPGKLRQILTNLLSNSIKFTNEGEIELLVEINRGCITSSKYYKNPVCLHFTLSDTGSGIPANKKNKIFEPFVQADETTGTKHRGSGLGLTIVKSLVELMDGNILFESEPNVGSDFHFSAIFGVLQQQRSIGDDSCYRNKNVLMVGENEEFFYSYKNTLENSGFSTIYVNNNDDALGIMCGAGGTTKSFDLILVDCQVTALNGFVLARKIKSLQPATHTKLLLLVGIGQPGDAILCKKYRVGGYLTKPVDHVFLLKSVKMCLAENGDFYQNNKHNKTGQLITNYTVNESKRRLQVLLAEDSEVNRIFIEGALKKRGYDVVSVSDGEKAVEICKQIKFDVVLMDIQMPVVNGKEGAKMIRCINGGKNIPIIAITGHKLQKDSEEFLSLDMDDYILKPFKVDELIGVIERNAGVDCSKGWDSDKSKNFDVDSGNPALVFDKNDLFERLGWDTRLARHLCCAFLKEGPVQMEKLKNEIKNGSLGTIEHEVHLLKGMYANVGAKTSWQLSSHIEKNASNGNMEMVQDGYVKLESEFSKFLALLKEFVD